MLENKYAFPVRVSIIDELPVQFQERKWIQENQDGFRCSHAILNIL